MPSCFLCSSGTEACVIREGDSASDSMAPSDSANANTRSYAQIAFNVRICIYLGGAIKLELCNVTYILEYDCSLFSTSNTIESYHCTIPILLTCGNIMLWMRF